MTRDPIGILPAGLRADLSDRAGRGIRISLAPDRLRARARARARARRLRERAARYEVEEIVYVPYGAAWTGGTDGGAESDELRALDYVVVDVETTGGGFADRVTEVAAVRLDGRGRLLGEYATLINPERRIPPAIVQLTRITQSMVARAPVFADVADEVERIVRGAVFVAHNASFDWRFLSRELTNARRERLRGRVLCTVRLARKVVPEITSRSLDALQFFFDVENDARHRAFGDARATAEIFRRLLDRVGDREIFLWGDLEKLLARRAARRRRLAMPQPVGDW